jgi:uncharacterized membrane protein
LDNKPVSYRTNLIISAIAILVMLAVSTFAWFRLPDGVPVCTHWNAAGVCDGWGSKATGLFLMPVVVPVVVALFAVIPRIDPRAANIARSRTAYTAVWVTMLLFFVVFHGIMTLNLLGYQADMGVLVPVLTGVMFVAIGSVMGRVKSNYFFGIRTPWTLASELSWEKTHRLGGVVFIVEGVLVAAGALLFPGDVWVYLLLGSIVVMLVTVTLYSYFVWKGDPDRPR